MLRHLSEYALSLCSSKNLRNYSYLYHQVIGFYLKKADYSDSQIVLMEKQEMFHDFYLDYQLKDPAYSERWRLFIHRVSKSA